jgi:hypothetical protein
VGRGRLERHLVGDEDVVRNRLDGADLVRQFLDRAYVERCGVGRGWLVGSYLVGQHVVGAYLERRFLGVSDLAMTWQ